MISIQPRTYNEVLRLQKCYTLASHYTDVTESEFDQMYRFLNQSDENAVIGNRHVVSLVDQNKKIIPFTQKMQGCYRRTKRKQ